MKNLLPKKLCKPSRSKSCSENIMVHAYDDEADAVDYVGCAFAAITVGVFIAGIIAVPAPGTEVGKLYLINAVVGFGASAWGLATCADSLFG